MTTISFSPAADDIFSVRKAIYRMIITRAKKDLEDADDINELEMSELFDDISLYTLPTAQRARLQSALISGASALRADIIAGRPTEDPTLLGIDEKLGELIEFMGAHFAS